MVEPPEILMDIREELMVSPRGGKPISKTSHFIKPMLHLTDTPPKLPTISLPFQPIFPNCTFNGWTIPTNQWVSWVNKLHSTYKITWKKAGIYEAILSSRYQVIKHEELVLGLAERWCFERNTFVFPWGEATITLEDVMILGGFSVLGNSVSGFTNDKQVAEVEKQLLTVYNKLCRGSTPKVDQGLWMKWFLGSRSEIEHEAFLTYWLSRFVFPIYPFDSIVPKFFKIAVCLSRGRELAIAPVVLASIYKDLTLLKSSMGNVDKVHDFGDDLLMVTLWAPLQLVQVWAWERFPEFRPKPNDIEFGLPRLARWHDVNEQEIGNVRPMLQSAGDSFEWRPYCKDVDNVPSLGLFREEEQWVFMDENVGKDVIVMAHCLRVTELVGLESIEQYNPHRVAMQFGFDQDLPHTVKRGMINSGIPQKELEQLAWLNYAVTIKDQLLYIPSRSYEPQVSLRYLKWFRKGVLIGEAALEGIVTRKSVSIRSRRLQPPRLFFVDDEVDLPPRFRPRKFSFPETDVQSDFEMNWSGNGLDVPPGLSPNINVSKKADVPPGFVSKKTVGQAFDVPPGFVPKNNATDLDAPPGVPLNSSVAKKKADVPPGFVSKKSVGHAIDVPPGFVPKSNGTDLDVPPGFPANSSVTKNKADVPHDFTMKKTVGGFVPKSIGYDPDVPPGFKPKCITPMKLDDVKKHGSVLEPLVKVKKECIEFIGDVQASHNLPGEIVPNEVKKSTDVAGNSSGKSNRAMCVDNAGNKLTPREIAPVVSHGRSLFDVKARVRQLEKIVSALKKEK